MKILKNLISFIFILISTNIMSQEILCNNIRDCLYVPNSFTPNNDNYNDIFCVSYQEPINKPIIEYRITILNKSGEIVFTSNEVTDCWDGSHQRGSYYIQNDIYTYLIFIRTKGDSFKIGGHIMVIR